MGAVTYIEHDGTSHTVEVPDGITLMDGSVRNNLPGILAECGGSCSCGTCHVYVEGRWFERLEEPDPAEIELLEFMGNHQENSRLSCQILMSRELDGIVVRVPEYES
jgi:2Fe-2S ferredoxin